MMQRARKGSFRESKVSVPVYDLDNDTESSQPVNRLAALCYCHQSNPANQPALYDIIDQSFEFANDVDQPLPSSQDINNRYGRIFFENDDDVSARLMLLLWAVLGTFSVVHHAKKSTNDRTSHTKSGPTSVLGILLIVSIQNIAGYVG